MTIRILKVCSFACFAAVTFILACQQGDGPAAPEESATFIPLQLQVGNRWAYRLRTEYLDSSRIDIETTFVEIISDTSIWTGPYDEPQEAFIFSSRFFGFNCLYYDNGTLYGTNVPPGGIPEIDGPDVVIPGTPVLGAHWLRALWSCSIEDNTVCPQSVGVLGSFPDCIRVSGTWSLSFPAILSEEYWAHEVGLIQRTRWYISATHSPDSQFSRDTTPIARYELISFDEASP